MIRRREFLSVCSALGLASVGCRSTPKPIIEASSKSDKSVIIIGAGVAGMSVGHLLAQQGVDFTILEAAPGYGGRVKTNHDFVDFPIPLGGEWIHVNEDILPKIVNDETVNVDTEIANYTPECIYGYV
ncbi:MAG: NAD(P)-binding protein, partial [Planctomycetota bacterium]